jgi:hypothetical protein
MRSIERRKGINKMRTFNKIFFSFVLMAGLTVSASAQRNDPKKPPPKPPPPKVEPHEKPPRERPKENRPKKPGFALALRIEQKGLA